MKSKPQTRKERADSTKNKIYESALCLIKEKGYDNVTVDEICKHAKVAKGSFYVHYPAKDYIIRESYYARMGAFLQSGYADFENNNPNAAFVEKILAFLTLELDYAIHAGFELTCRAFALNLSACINKDSDHFQKRHFTKTLFHEIDENKDCLYPQWTSQSAFSYLESLIRGIEATWCFSNGNYPIAIEGRFFLHQALLKIFREETLPASFDKK